MSDLLERLAASDDPVKVWSRLVMESVAVHVANEHHGLVHSSWMRPFFPVWLDGPSVGSQMTSMVRRGVLVDTGRTAPLEGYRSRNGLRPAKVYRLARPDLLGEVLDVWDIPEEDPLRREGWDKLVPIPETDLEVLTRGQVTLAQLARAWNEGWSARAQAPTLDGWVLIQGLNPYRQAPTQAEGKRP